MMYLEMHTYYRVMKKNLVKFTASLVSIPVTVPLFTRNMRRLKKGMLLAREYMKDALLEHELKEFDALKLEGEASYERRGLFFYEQDLEQLQ